MRKESKCFEVRTNGGKVILSLYVYDSEVAEVKSPEFSDGKKEETKIEKMHETSQTDGKEMTDAQKRFIFRLLAGQGVEGETAHEKLKLYFQVNSLKDVSKYEASKLIEKLLEESKGETDDRIPF